MNSVLHSKNQIWELHNDEKRHKIFLKMSKTYNQGEKLGGIQDYIPSKVVMISNGVISLVLLPQRMASKTINTTDDCKI